jgi:two-component system chemotaxis sensor kinase CheA
MSRPADDDAALIAVFLSEAAELLDALDSCLLDLLSTSDDADLVHRTFRVLHTLKGVAAMYGYAQLSAEAHALESVFDEARRNHSAVPRESVEHALRQADEMRLLLAEPTAETAREAPTPAPAQPSGRFSVALHPAADAFDRGLRLGAIIAELASLGECSVSAGASSSQPPSDDEAPRTQLSWRADLTTDAEKDRVLEALMFLGPHEYELEEAAPATSMAPEPERRSNEDRRRGGRRSNDARETDTIRVASHRLDELVDLVGELVTAHGSMSSLAAETNDSRLTSVAEEIGRISSELRENALSIRMVPIGTVFGKFRRHVHDLANELGKHAEIEMRGGETELDKGVLDHLSEPILHILRNSLDHGIEAPEVRSASSKSPVGHISLSASQAGGRVHVLVTDDGGGIDFERVRAKAIERGLIAADAKADDDALAQLLFGAGFSTSEGVTSLSGRGVGLDVVRRMIDSLHGTVTLTSEPGRGTTIALSLPLTLAIIDGLISTVGAERYAIPLAIVEECAEVSRPEAWRVHQRDLLDVHGSLLPLVHLRSFFEVPGEPPEYQIAVIVSVDERRFGIVVDGLIDNVQTVIKPLGSFMKRADGVSGTTVLGDGGVVPIIDPTELVRIADFEQASGEGGAPC